MRNSHIQFGLIRKLKWICLKRPIPTEPKFQRGEIVTVKTGSYKLTYSKDFQCFIHKKDWFVVDTIELHFGTYYYDLLLMKNHKENYYWGVHIEEDDIVKDGVKH